MWIAMKARSAAWWLLGTAAALLACAWAVRATLPGLGSETCAEVLLIEMVATCPLLLALRLVGVAITDEPNPVADPRDRQFSLRSLFVWTAVVAILLSLFQIYPMTVMGSDSVNPLRSALELILVFLASALIGLGVMWAVLGQGRAALRGLLLLALVVVPSLVALPNVVWWQRWMFFACHVGVMTASLGAFRWAGYRLLWLGKPQVAVPS
jgi:magnesium-transporting ATPase (P-type)